MSYIKVHVIPGKELSVEGEEASVRDILERYAPLSVVGTSPVETSSVVGAVSPTLSTVVYQNTPKTEAEWLLVYVYFSPKPQVSRQEILESYKHTQRYTTNHSKNLSFNLRLCVKHRWMQAHDDGLFSLTPLGVAHVQEIFSRSG